MKRLLLFTLTILLSGVCARGQIWVRTMDGKASTTAEVGLGSHNRNFFPNKMA